MAYGARLESVLGASPRGFESPILRVWSVGNAPPIRELLARRPSHYEPVTAAGRSRARAPAAGSVLADSRHHVERSA